MSTTVTQTVTDSTPSQSLALKGTRSVKTTVQYLDKSVTHPFTYAHNEFEGPRTNHVLNDVEVDVLDLSSTNAAQRQQLGLNIDESGFAVVDGWGDESSGIADKWAAQTWDAPNEFLEQEYYKDIDALLKKHAGATSTFVFDHTVRKRRPGELKSIHKDETPETRQPVSFVHSDQNRWAGENRLRKHLGEETLQKVLKGELHAQIINVWRPLRGVANDWPLGFADSRTVSSDDWVMQELRYKDWTGQTLAIHKNPAHKWYYYRGLPTSKAILLKCYDSVTETRTPHTAFFDPETPEDAEPRWSVEIRTLVITNPKLKQ